MCYYACFNDLRFFSQPENRLTPEQWKQDIDYYFDNFEKVHLNPYHKTSKKNLKI